MDPLAGASVGTGSTGGGADPLAGASAGYKAPAPAAPAAPAPSAAPAPKGGGGSPALPAMPAVSTSTPPAPTTGSLVQKTPAPVDTTSMFSKFLTANPDLTPSTSTQTTTPAVSNPPKVVNGKQVTDNPVEAAITGGTTIPQFLSDTYEGIPKAAEDVSGAINKAVIQTPADLLAKTPFIKQAAAGINAGSESGLFAQDLLHRLSYGLSTISGLTGGVYQAPKNVAEDSLDKGMSALAAGIGQAVSMSTLGSVLTPEKAISAFGSFASKFPLVGKYIAPYAAPLLQNVTGFAAYSQLDPSLIKAGQVEHPGGNQDYTIVHTFADDMNARAGKLLEAIGSAPLYTALGAIKNVGFSLPASFGLGYGMAKLSGANNQDALSAGFAFGMLDLFGRAGGTHETTRGLSPEEINTQLKREAANVLSQHSGMEVTPEADANTLKVAWRAAAHQTHPDLGGNTQDFIAAKNAYDILSGGKVSEMQAKGDTKTAPETPEEKSVKLLAGEVKDVSATHGPEVAKTALQEKLGVNEATADRIVNGPQKNVETINPHEVLASVTAPTEDMLKEAYVPPRDIYSVHATSEVPGGMTSARYHQIEGKAATLGVSGVPEDFFVHRPFTVDGGHLVVSDSGWTVSERRSGLSVGAGIHPTQEAAIAAAKEQVAQQGAERTNEAISQGVNRHGETPPVEKVTQKEQVKQVVAKKPMSIKQVAELTHILEPNVRRILGVGAKDGTFERVSEGVYVLKSKKGNFAYIEMGDAKEVLARMAEEGQKFDSVILDPAYFSRALIGGNRGIKKWGFIMPPDFAEVMKSVSKLVHNDETHVYLMLSGARTAQPDMVKYVEGATDAGFKVVGEGSYTKLTKGGEPVTNVRGQEAAAERLILLTKSGNARVGETEKQLNFRYIRPSIAKSYQTEKPAELMRALITQSTLKGETVLDPFAGSGVTGAEAIRSERNVALIEKSGEAIDQFTRPRVEEAAKEGEVTPPETPTGDHQIEASGGGAARPLKRQEPKVRVPTDEEAPVRPEFEQPENLYNQGINYKRGFINPEELVRPAAEAVKNFHDAIEHHQVVSDIVGGISTSIYQAEGANKALKVRLTKLIEDVRKNSTAEEREHVYHHMEDSRYPLTEHEREYLLPVVREMDATLTELRAKARAEGVYITGDILDEHTPRNAMEKGGVIDKALEAYAEGKKKLLNGGKLSTSVGSGSKHRVFYALTDEAGNRTVVSIKKGQVTGFKNGKPYEMGSTDKIVTPKVREFYDFNVMSKLQKLAEDLGVKHERYATGRTPGLGGNRAGVSFQGENLIKTRLSPDQVLAHELGHQIDHKYGLEAFMKEERYDREHKSIISKELRALADKRFEGLPDATDSFKKYVRKGSEKMAVMFEAYVSNREMFKEVAPHLYDDFTQFLSDHVELRPFLDVRPGLTLGSERHGGEHLAGIKGSTFVDADGKKYTVGQATTIEIEKNTSVKYYKDPLANYALAIERTARATRALELLKKIKESDEFKHAIVKEEGDVQIPSDWKTTKLPQFRGYRMEPHLAEAFDDMATRQDGGIRIPVYDQINNVLIAALVINPVMHFPNVAMGWGSQVAAAGFVPEVDFIDTFKSVMNKDEDYLKWVEAGAPMQYLRQTHAEFADAILHDFTQEIANSGDQYDKIWHALGYANPVEWAKALEEFSADATWVGNDVMLYNALKTYQKKTGATMEKTIEEVSKRMADYHIPPRILGSRALSLVMQNNALFMFMRYHYSGVIKPWITAVGDTFDPRGSSTGGPDAQQRLAGMRTLAYFALMYFIWQMAINKPLEKATGNPNTYMSMPGAMRIVQNTKKSIELGSPLPIMTSLVSFNPGVKLVGSLMTGVDWNNYFKPIYGPGGEGVVPVLKGSASPYNAVEGAFTGVSSWTDFAKSLGGVYSPKTTTAQAVFNSMMNVEKPNVEMDIKAKIAAGDMAGALQEAKDFNNRLKDVIRAADISNGNSGSDARVNYYFSVYPNGLGQKGYAIRMPSAKSMANYESKQGLTSGQKYLPGGGNVESEKGKPSDITNVTDPGTVHATVHGVTIYNRMTNELAVRAQIMAANGMTYAPKTYQLDHIVPLEGGGTNEATNLQVIPVAQDNINQQVEDYIGQHIQAGTMSAAQAREIVIRFKAGLGQTLTPQLMQEYQSKYGGKPLTLQEIYDYKNTLITK